MGNYCVYKHTSPTGKVYIGITSKPPAERWKSGNGYRQNKRFYNAIKKYGWDNFTHEILIDGVSKEEACRIEIELIYRHESFTYEHGYNQSLGGEHGNHSDATKEKLSKSESALWEDESYRKHMSEAHKGKSRTGWKHTEEAKQKMSEFQKQLPEAVVRKRVQRLTEYNRSEAGRKENGERGKRLWESDEFRRKSTRHLYGNTFRRKSVICLETGEVFETVEAAANSVGLTRDAIGRVCRGDGKMSGGYHWRFADE